MGIPRPLLALACLCAAAPLARADGDLRQALALLDRGEFAASENLLRTLAASEPSNALIWFNLGSAAFNAGHLDAADGAFEKVITLGSRLAPGARLCRVKCARKKGDLDRAASQLEELKAVPELASLVPAEARNLAEAYRARADADYGIGLDLLRQGRRGDARDRLQSALAGGSSDTQRDARYHLERLDADQGAGATWLWLEAGAGVDSNLFLDGDSSSPSAAGVTETSLSAGHELREGGFFARGSGQLFAELPFSIPSGRYISSTGRVELGFDGGEFSLKLTPGVQYQVSGTTPYALRALTGLSFQKNLGLASLGLQYEVARAWARSDELPYVSGNSHALAAYYDQIGSGYDLRLHYSMYVENSGDSVSGSYVLPLKNIGHGPGVRLRFFPATDWEVSASAAYLFRSYPSLAEPDGIARSDRQLTGYARATYRVVPGLSAFASASATDNESTLGSTSFVSDRNYTQLSGIAGLTWKILD